MSYFCNKEELTDQKPRPTVPLLILHFWFLEDLSGLVLLLSLSPFLCPQDHHLGKYQSLLINTLLISRIKLQRDNLSFIINDKFLLRKFTSHENYTLYQQWIIPLLPG